MDNIYGYIYKITNTVNGKIYIGQTIRCIEERFKEHCKPHNNEHSKFMPISRAIKKYGKNNFIIEIIDTAESRDELNEKEKQQICFNNSLNKKAGYNISSGGGNGNNFAGKNNEEFGEIRNKISESLKKYWNDLSEEKRKELIFCFNERTRLYMKNLTAEQRGAIGERFSKTLRGKKMTQQQRKNMSTARIGVRFSDERILKNAINKDHKFHDQNIEKSRKQQTPKQPLKSDSKTGDKNPMYGVRGEKNNKSITIKCINLITGNEMVICGIHSAARALMIPATKICSVLKGRTRTACGYKFEYVN